MDDINVMIEQPVINVTIEWQTWEKGVWITSIVDNWDWTFTRTYWDWATQITTIDLTWHTGPTGATGPTWETWPTWWTGWVWATWETGPTWLTWATWPTGPTGHFWETGATGPTGSTWPTWIWATWPTGPSWKDWKDWATWETWETWATWETGPTWETWETGPTWIWEKWETGETGPTWIGETWPTWETGETWPTWETGETWPTWETGATWETWETWETWPTWPWYDFIGTRVSGGSYDEMKNVLYLWTTYVCILAVSGSIITPDIDTTHRRIFAEKGGVGATGPTWIWATGPTWPTGIWEKGATGATGPTWETWPTWIWATGPTGPTWVWTVWATGPTGPTWIGATWPTWPTWIWATGPTWPTGATWPTWTWVTFWTAMATATRVNWTSFTVTWDQTAIFKKWLMIKWLEWATARLGMVSIPSTVSWDTTVTIIGNTIASGAGNFASVYYSTDDPKIVMFAIAWAIWVAMTSVANARYADKPYMVMGAELMVWVVASTSWNTVIDINNNGTTMFTAKPTIAYNALSVATPFTADTATALALNDRVSIDIDTVTSTTFPTDLYVKLYLFPTRLLSLV